LTIQQIQEALFILQNGGLVAYPTDTVYGLGADAFNAAAVRKIYAAKDRAAHLPLPLLVADLEMLRDTAAELSDLALSLATRFMPGPLTIIVPKAPSVPDTVTAGGPNVALRIPAHPVPRALAAGLAGPLVGTSANRSGEGSATTAREVHRELGDAVDVIIEGECTGGVESTVLDLTQGKPIVVRAGAIPLEELEEALGTAVV